MICVSYTRAVSNCSAMKEEDVAIGKQNEAIQTFLKTKKGWKLQQRYSDRKHDRNDETAFLQMKRDGMKREFECVIFSSLFYCGKKMHSAINLLKRVFCPAGIYFAVAEDGFCSCEATSEEIEQYIDDKLYIDPTEINRAVLEGLKKEHQKAQIALERLKMPETKARLEEIIKPLRAEAIAMYQTMVQTEQTYIELSNRKDATQDESLIGVCADLLSKQTNQDRMLQAILNQIDRMEKCYSDQNPWVTLYLGYDSQQPFSSKTDRKYVERILVHRFEYAYLVPKEQEWFRELPQEWFAEV